MSEVTKNRKQGYVMKMILMYLAFLLFLFSSRSGMDWSFCKWFVWVTWINITQSYLISDSGDQLHVLSYLYDVTISQTHSYDSDLLKHFREHVYLHVSLSAVLFTSQQSYDHIIPYWVGGERSSNATTKFNRGTAIGQGDIRQEVL